MVLGRFTLLHQQHGSCGRKWALASHLTSKARQGFSMHAGEVRAAGSWLGRAERCTTVVAQEGHLLGSIGQHDEHVVYAELAQQVCSLLHGCRMQVSSKQDDLAVMADGLKGAR